MDNGRPETPGDIARSGEITGIRASEEASPVSFSNGRVAVEIDTSIYSVDAILRAIYKFTDRCYVLLHSDTAPHHCVVHLTAKSPSSELEQLVGEFGNELLDQQLRQRLEQQFGEIRSLIVAQAFAEGNLLDRDRDEGDYLLDPRGIGGPPR